MNFELIFVKCIRSVSRYIFFCMCMPHCSRITRITCWKDYLCSFILPLLFYQRSADYIFMSLFPDSLFCSIDLFVYSQDSHVFWCRGIGKVDVEKEHDFSVYEYHALMRQMNWASSLMWSQGGDKWRQKLPPANSGPQAGSCSQRSILAQPLFFPRPYTSRGKALPTQGSLWLVPTLHL